MSSPALAIRDREYLANKIDILKAENEELKLRVAELADESRTKHEYAMQMLGERGRVQSELTLLRSKLNVHDLTEMVRYYGYVTYKPAREIAEFILKELS